MRIFDYETEAYDSYTPIPAPIVRLEITDDKPRFETPGATTSLISMGVGLVLLVGFMKSIEKVIKRGP
jgi:hypothetical protein